MKKRMYGKAMCLVIILTGVLIVSINATAQTTTQMTALEKKLYEAALKEGKLEWWDSLKMVEAAGFMKGFSSKYPGVKVEYFEGTAEVREEKYLLEQSAGRRTMDLTSLDQYKLFKEKNLLVDISDIIKDIKYPMQFCAKDMMGTSVEHVILGTAYNTKLVSPKDVPKSYEDLLDPKWKGRKIAVEDQLKLFIYLTPIWGKEKTANYLKKMAEQNVIFSKNATQMSVLLSAGEYPITMSGNLHRILSMKLEGAPVEWAPISPAINKLSPWAVMREGPHPNAAKLFLRYCISPEGQQLVDKIRNKGNPLPGSQTSQSKAIEKMGLEIVSLPGWEIEPKEMMELDVLYSDALGYKRK